MRTGFAIYQILQFLARFEERNFLRGNVHAISGFGVASHAGLALPGAETAKAPNLNLVPSSQGADDAVKDGLHDHLAVFAGQFNQTGNLVDQIRFRHGYFALQFVENASVARFTVAMASPYAGSKAFRITFSNFRACWQEADAITALLLPKIVKPNLLIEQLFLRRQPWCHIAE